MNRSAAVTAKLARTREVQLSLTNQVLRVAWSLVYWTAFRFSPTPLHGWRRMLLRLFGAKIGQGAHIYSSAAIWAPWNLSMGVNTCLARCVQCYCVDRIQILDNAIVSQEAFLCTASHDYTKPGFPLTAGPICIGEQAWVAARAFVGPGVTIGSFAVVGATATVFRDVAPSTVVAGNPAQEIKKRNLSTREI